MTDHLRAELRNALRIVLRQINESEPAGAPMVFLCEGCIDVIKVPECYVIKPSRCPSCGGPWSRP